MHGGPGELVLGDLFLPLFEGAELVIVLVEVFEKLFQGLCDIFINPGSVLQLCYQVQCIDHGQVVKTFLVFFYVLS